MFPSPTTADVVVPPETNANFNDGMVVIGPLNGERLVLY